MFATSRWYPVDHDKKIVWLESKGRKIDCADRPSCVGVSGFQLKTEWEKYEAEGYRAAKSTLKDSRGGLRTGSGRPRKSIKTVRVKISSEVHSQITEQVAIWSRQKGQHLSVQDYISSLILRADKLTERIAPEICTWSEPWGWVTLTQEASDQLDRLVAKLKPMRPDIFVNRANVLCAVAIVAQRLKSKPDSLL